MNAKGTTSPQSADSLARWLGDQRWYTSRPDPTAGDVVVHGVPLDTRPTVAPAIVLVPSASGPAGHAGTEEGVHDAYQLLLKPGPAGAAGPDLGGDPAALGALGRFVASAGTATADGITITARWSPGAPLPGRARARTLGVEQTNSSAVLGGTHVLKAFRRLHPGRHPEIVIGRHLAEVAATGQAVPVPSLTGWYEATDASGTHALGVVHVLVPGALDGWSLALGALAGDPGGLLSRLRELGTTIAHLHAALAMPSAGDPAAFGRSTLPPGRLVEVADAVAASAVQELDPSVAGPALADLAGTAPRIAALATDLVTAIGADTGPAIRHHGDLHLGQVLLGPAGWVVVDFEGEPDRPLAERGRHHAPLRDLAGLLRSIAYAVATHDLANGHLTPPGWEAAARAALLDGYLAHVPADLLPSSAVATRDLLALFELEKLVYELRYERLHRPDWSAVPARGVRNLLDRSSS